MRAVLIAGTHEWDGGEPTGWHVPGSPFVEFIQAQGIQPVFADNRPYLWSTGLGGVGIGNKDLAVWEAAGINLLAYCVPPLCPERRIPANDLLVITHSHGLQVALYAFAYGLKGRLIDVSGPVRKDMRVIAEAARPNIRSWTHIHSDQSDRWQWLGELFDGHLGIVRKHPLADRNSLVAGVGHSELLNDPTLFHHWITRAWFDNWGPAERKAA
jgi:hypothetical protein